jgi:hypothetical protein
MAAPKVETSIMENTRTKIDKTVREEEVHLTTINHFLVLAKTVTTSNT